MILITLILLCAVSGTRANPEIERDINWDSPETRELFQNACGDCHSYETKWPWYSRIAPISWMIIRNVNEGREEFNVSASALGEADEAAEEVLEDEMPPWEYVLLHPEAKLTAAQKDVLVTGLLNTFGGERKENKHDEDNEHDDHSE
ncbi:MAG: heme-binding domain-containing protein [Candidatus Hydrogenedentes bacterium]|nr:heme-binding domain-containing protein [Candidatus Hydrogenedentota bacterium]